MKLVRKWSHNYYKSFSFVGLIFAILFFAASVTPSLLPRTMLFQGLLSGFALAIGYGVGEAVMRIWEFLEIPSPAQRIQKALKTLVGVSAVAVFGYYLWQMAFWQNSIRTLMQMPEIESAYPTTTAAIAIAFAAFLVGISRILKVASRSISGKLGRYLPRRIAFGISLTVVAFTVYFIGNGVIGKALLNAADNFFLAADELVDDDVEKPSDPLACGSDTSLVKWDAIGRRGKNFIVNGPSAKNISDFWNAESKQPVRVYVSMRSTESSRDQAKLALAELKRAGGFDRSLLVVATPTGTGWLDPGAVDTIEYMHRGDTAIVSMQYSYLPSWISILVDPDKSIRSARYLFEEIYGYWKTLPPDKRPKLYLHGLSLGSLGSEMSAAWYNVLEDPYHGALWSGPPFASRNWATFTQNRNPGTPAWLPRFRDGSLIRFTSQQNTLQQGERWGPIRNVYIQYASDPMTFFSPDLLFHKPEWLIGQRGPDVSPYLTWFPLVTFLKIAFDLPMALTVPEGYGHNFAPTHYIDAWVSVTGLENWQESDTKRLAEMIKPAIP